ncbi:hypothetical protein GQ457_16G027070 [Hibiscus cannabinus]
MSFSTDRPSIRPLGFAVRGSDGRRKRDRNRYCWQSAGGRDHGAAKCGAGEGPRDRGVVCRQGTTGAAAECTDSAHEDNIHWAQDLDN